MTLKACVQCGRPSTQSRCPPHRTRRNGSTRAWRTVRQAILERDGYQCKVQLPGCEQHANEVDHIRRVIDGGTDHPTNLRATCGPCNRARPR